MDRGDTIISSPRVSVIIPTYNRARFVTKAIDSVLAQTYTDYEIIVIDDGSSDNTREILGPYMDKIQYIYQENAGASAARNPGISAATGEWVAFLDSDDEWLPEKLSIQMAHVRERPDLCAHITDVTFITADGEQVGFFEIRNFPKRWDKEFVLARPLKYVLNYDVPCTPSFIAKRSILFDAGLFDEHLRVSEDKDLFLRVALQGTWGGSSLKLVNCYRRDEPNVSLTRQFGGEKISKLKAIVYRLNKIKGDPRLNSEERDLLNQSLSRWIFKLGLLQQRRGRRSEAGENFKLSVRLYPSVNSCLRYMLTLLPDSLAHWLFDMWRQRKGPGFHV